MGIYGGLKPDDWNRWGQFTTFKENAAQLVRKQMRPNMRIYFSPLVDPYQPAEEQQRLMPEILKAMMAYPPEVLTIQTRGPLITLDLESLVKLDRITSLRISFSVTTNRDEIRRLYEPHCATFEDRVRVIRELRSAGLTVHATLAPILPCDPDILLDAAMEATSENIASDPFHVRSTKRHGATTRDQAFRIAAKHGHEDWFEAGFQSRLVAKMKDRAARAGRRFGAGPESFSWLSQPTHKFQTSSIVSA